MTHSPLAIILLPFRQDRAGQQKTLRLDEGGDASAIFFSPQKKIFDYPSAKRPHSSRWRRAPSSFA
jgi:hypothetical protein